VLTKKFWFGSLIVGLVFSLIFGLLAISAGKPEILAYATFILEIACVGGIGMAGCSGPSNQMRALRLVGPFMLAQTGSSMLAHHFLF